MTFKLLGSTDAASQSLGVMTEGIGFPLHPVEPSGGGGSSIALTENVTYTVGAGQDFENIDDAFAFINSAPIGAGNAQSEYADTRIPRYTLALTAGTFESGSPQKFLRMEGTTAQVAIVGAGSGLTTLGAPKDISIQFTNCNNIRFDAIKIEGYLTCNNSTVIFGYSDFDVDLTNCYLNGSHFTEYRLGVDLSCRYLHLGDNSICSGGDFVFDNDETNIEAIVLDYNSFLSASTIAITMPGNATREAINCTYGSTICASGALTLNGGAAGRPAISALYSAKVQTGGIVDNSAYDAVGNIAVAQIQPDTSVIADGTALTLAT